MKTLAAIVESLLRGARWVLALLLVVGCSTDAQSRVPHHSPEPTPPPNHEAPRFPDSSETAVWESLHFGDSEAEVTRKIEQLIADGVIDDSHKWEGMLFPLYTRMAGVVLQVGFGFTNDEFDYLYFLSQDRSSEAAAKRDYETLLSYLTDSRGVKFVTRRWELLSPQPNSVDFGAFGSIGPRIDVRAGKGLTGQGDVYAHLTFVWVR